jgi:hypothetical protein
MLSNPARAWRAPVGLLAVAALTAPVSAGDSATLWGYGVKPCSAFVAAAADVPDALRDAEHARYREWLAGLVSGLNLATASDVLRGAELDAALARIRAQCEKTPEADFFSVSLDLIKSLSGEDRRP